MFRITATAALLALAPLASRAAPCEGWLSPDFWESARPAEVLACLADGRDVTERTPDGRTPLHLAAANAGDAAEARVLLRAGAALDSIDAKGWRPIHAAAETPDPAIILALLLAGAEPEARIGKDACSLPSMATCAPTPLHLAARNADAVEVAVALMVAGADPGRLDDQQRTALHVAARSDSGAEMARVLIEGGAPVGKDDARGRTPLHLAADADAGAGMVGALLAAGASADARDDEGDTPLHLAAARVSSPRVFAMLAGAAETPCALDDRKVSALDTLDARRTRNIARGADPALPRDNTYWRLHQLCRGGESGG